MKKPATFDARAFNIPGEDVANYFLWRAKDWRRNSVLGLAQYHFSSKALHGANQAKALEMLARIGVRWEELPAHLKNGRFYLPRLREYEDVEPSYQAVAAMMERALAPASNDGGAADGRT